MSFGLRRVRDERLLTGSIGQLYRASSLISRWLPGCSAAGTMKMAGWNVAKE